MSLAGFLRNVGSIARYHLTYIALLEERTVVLGKLKRHREALEVLVDVLENPYLAERLLDVS